MKKWIFAASLLLTFNSVLAQDTVSTMSGTTTTTTTPVVTTSPTVTTTTTPVMTTTVSTASTADATMAQQLIENWFAAMKANDVNKASSYLSPQFISLHADGIVRNKAAELDLIKNLNMKDYKLTDFQVNSAGDNLIVTFKDQGVEKMDNRPMGRQPAGKMAVLHQENGQWVIFAYANLDSV